MIRYFITVDWCNRGRRGIFCNRIGEACIKDEPHTDEEMQEALGPFWVILKPESTPLTEEELKEYKHFYPLAEYSSEWGIAEKQ